MTDQKDKMMEAMKAAAKVPRVDYWGGLMGQLAMTGAKIVPERLWASTIKLITRWSDGEPTDLGAFQEHENHLRGGDHEEWQYRTFGGKPDLWVIPVDEFVCYNYGTMDACDFVSITRLTFEGTEAEMEAELTRLFKQLC